MRILKHLLSFVVCFFSISLFSQKDAAVYGYIKKDSSFIQPIYRTSPRNSMLQYYCNTGSFNPYTGLPDWTEAYQKVSVEYRNNLPSAYKEKYGELFNNLLRQDTVNYFKYTNSFENTYKLFFTGLFKYNVNDIEGAYKAFEELNNVKQKDSFIYKENTFWLEASLRYVNATKEFSDLYTAVEKYEGDRNFDALINKIDAVKNPLNFYDKYLLKYNIELEQYHYLSAITALDSLKKYSPDADRKNLVVGNYKELVEILSLKQNYLDAVKNGTYYYPLDSLYNNLIFYDTTYKLPHIYLQKAGFAIEKKRCNDIDSVLSRHLIDTLRSSTFKIDETIDFTRNIRKQGDTLLIASLFFKDSSVYAYYKKLLSDNFPNTHSIKRSVAYDFTNTMGEEYLIYNTVVGGLVFDNDTNMYHLYIYCIANEGRLENLTSFFD